MVGSWNRKKFSPTLTSTITSPLTSTIPLGAPRPLGRSEEESSYSQFTDGETSPKRERDQPRLGLESTPPDSHLRQESRCKPGPRTHRSAAWSVGLLTSPPFYW